MQPEPNETAKLPPEDRAEPEFLGAFQKQIEAYAEAMNAGQTELAMQTAMGAMFMAFQDAMAHPKPKFKLKVQADELMRAGDWVGAEERLREILALELNGDIPGLVAKAYLDLSEMFQLLGKWDAAWDNARLATEAARKADMYPLTAMVLWNEAYCALAQGKPALALAAATEALQVLVPEKVADLLRARALVIHAECCLECQQLEPVESNLQAADALLIPQESCHFCSGPASVRMKWYRVQAKFHQHNRNFQTALDYAEKAVQTRKERLDPIGEASPPGYAALARDYQLLAEIYQNLRNQVGFKEAQAEAQAIWAKLHLPPIR